MKEIDLEPYLIPLISRLIGVICAWLVTKTGINVDEATQNSISLAVYAGVHKVVEIYFNKKREDSINANGHLE